VLDDGPGGAERVGADAEHHGVAGAQHAARVGEHVRTTLEHEPHHPEGRPPQLHPPALVLHGAHQLVATGRLGHPTPQPVDHVGPHLGAQFQPGGGATPRLRCGDVRGVRSGDGGERGVVGQAGGEGRVERRDLLVGARGQLGERGPGRRHRCAHPIVLGLRDVQERAVVLHHHEPVTLTERRGKIVRHGGRPVAAEHDHLARLQRGQRRSGGSLHGHETQVCNPSGP
jgi:hypothetical protein